MYEDEAKLYVSKLLMAKSLTSGSNAIFSLVDWLWQTILQMHMKEEEEDDDDDD